MTMAEKLERRFSRREPNDPIEFLDWIAEIDPHAIMETKHGGLRVQFTDKSTWTDLVRPH